MFWGGAGYGAGILARDYGMPFPLAALGGMLLAAALALPVGYLSVRRRGIYFAMVTLAFGQMVFHVVNEWRSVTGGENGLQGVPRLFPGLALDDPTAYYYAALPFALAGYWLANRVVRSPFGHVLVAIRDNEVRAQALGYATRTYKLVAFVLSAALAGLAGSLSAIGHGFAALEMVHWTTSGQAVVMVVLGGIGTLWGAVVGAAIVLLLRDALSVWTDAWGVVLGAVFVLVVLGFRRGVWGALRESRLLGGLPAPRPADDAAARPPPAAPTPASSP
jgi:branched-chain amino acid transport system permease protein